MHAMIHGPFWAQHIFFLATAGVIVAYTIIAFQFWDMRGNAKIGTADGSHAKSEAKRALGELVAIFILCALSGYVPKLFFALIPNIVPSLWPVMLGSHVALAFWAMKYALGRQTSHIMARLN